MSKQWTIQLFGGLVLKKGQQPPLDLKEMRRQSRVLLAYLAYFPQGHTRTALARIIWDRPGIKKHNQLKPIVTPLRKIAHESGQAPIITGLGSADILGDGEGMIGLNLELVKVDVLEFARLKAQDTIADLLAAIKMYRVLLPEFGSGKHNTRWLDVERRKLEVSYSNTIQRLIEKLEQDGQSNAEPPGHPAGSSKVLKYARVLPSLEPGSIELLKTIRRIEAELASRIPTNLPLTQLPLIGREPEKDRIIKLLTPRHSKTANSLASGRLLVLTGPGGIGKTHLAYHIAAEIKPKFSDGVFAVKLAPLKDSKAVIPTIAETLGLACGDQSPLETLERYLWDKQMFLLLDNFETVMEAQQDLIPILEYCPKLKVLVTSRIALDPRIADHLPIPPLAQAAELFAERAHALKHDLTLTPENAPLIKAICQELDGLPLAIELAAAHVHLSLPVILDQLRHSRLLLLKSVLPQADPRQRTMGATIAWSYELLSKHKGAQKFFRRLAVFYGGCTLEAIQFLDPERAEEVVSLVDVLVKCNLLYEEIVAPLSLETGFPEHESSPQVRFHMLEVIREYALERLIESGEEPTMRRRHAQFFIKVAEDTWERIDWIDQAAWVRNLELDYANVLAALDWAARDPESAEVGLQIAGALQTYWLRHHRQAEGLERFQVAIHHAGTLGSKEIRARAFLGAGILSRHQEDVTTAHRFLDQALALYQEMGNLRLISYTLAQKGEFQAAINLVREAGDERAIPRLAYEQGATAYEKGDYRWARQCFTEAHILSERFFGHVIVGQEHMPLGDLDLIDGNFDSARQHYECFLKSRETYDYKNCIAWAKRRLGNLEGLGGNYEQAEAHYVESLNLTHTLDDRRGTAVVLQDMGYLALAQGKSDQARKIFNDALKIRRQLRYRRDMVESLAGFATLAARQQEWEKASYLIHTVELLSLTCGWRLDPISHHDYEQQVAMLHPKIREDLGEKDAISPGFVNLTIEQGVSRALEAQNNQSKINPNVTHHSKPAKIEVSAPSL